MSIDRELLNKLEASNFKLTMQRKHLLSYLQANNHVTPEACLDGLKKERYEIGLATIYRNLSAFIDVGIVKRVRINDKYMYELDTTKHVHLVCSRCGEVIEISISTNENLTIFENTYGFKVTDVTAEIKGVCSNCVNQQ